MSLTEVADALENHPDARPYHKLLALEVRTRQDPILTTNSLQTRYSASETAIDETLAALAAWLNKIGRPAKTLEVLPETHARPTAGPFPSHIWTRLGARNAGMKVKDLLSSEHSVRSIHARNTCILPSRRRISGSATGATNEWQRALEVANTSEKALALASYAEQNSANDIADAAYSVAIKIVPRNRQAYAGRLRLALAAGETAQAQTIAARDLSGLAG